MFDFSDYLQDSIEFHSMFFDLANKKVIGKASKKVIGKKKNKFKGKTISEFVGLKSKMYSLIVVDGEEFKKAKGVNKNVVRK